jgi:hypothetical protein
MDPKSWFRWVGRFFADGEQTPPLPTILKTAKVYRPNGDVYCTIEQMSNDKICLYFETMPTYKIYFARKAVSQMVEILNTMKK